MKLQTLIANTLILTTLFASTAQAAAMTALPPGLGDFRDSTDFQEIPASQRLLKPLLHKILENDAFKGEEGKQKLLEILDHVLELGREKALANIDRMSEDQLR